jgi:hypothetical protein
MLKRAFSVLLLVICFSISANAEDLSATVQARVSMETEKAKEIALDPVIVRAVKESNASKPAQMKGMTQEKWENLAANDPVIVSLSNNAAAQFIKSHASDLVSEAFVSGADGTKVALLSKTTNWSHIGIPKHEQPMQGKTWQGKIDRDLSTDVLQLQISVPVRDGAKVIGSLVLGLKVRDLANRRVALN